MCVWCRKSELALSLGRPSYARPPPPLSPSRFKPPAASREGPLFRIDECVLVNLSPSLLSLLCLVRVLAGLFAKVSRVHPVVFLLFYRVVDPFPYRTTLNVL